jgi:hypothetical protein
MEIIARPHVVFECIVTLRGKRRNMARASAYWHIPTYLQTNSANCTIKYLIILGSLTRQTERCAPPPPLPRSQSLLLIHPPKLYKKLFPEKNAFIQTQTLAAGGVRYIFPLDRRGFTT